MKIGVQLFGVSEGCKKNPEDLFARLAEMGFEMVEPCVAVGSLGGFEAKLWDPQELRQNLPLIRRFGFNIPSFHVLTADLEAALEEVCALVGDTGAKQVVVKCPAEMDEGYAAVCRTAAERLAQCGAALLLHNSFEEIANRADGVTVYERMADACHAGMQVDAGWALYGGEQPESLLERCQGRVRSLHYKDVSGIMGAVEPGKSNVAVGDGLLNVEACFRFASAQGIPQIIDQDASAGDLMEDLAKACRLLKSFA